MALDWYVRYLSYSYYRTYILIRRHEYYISDSRHVLLTLPLECVTVECLPTHKLLT